MKKLSFLILSALLMVMPAQAATKYGAQYTNQFVTVPPTKVDPNVAGGKLGHCYDTYTFTADLASGDVIKLCKLPAGARVLALTLGWDDLDASGGTVDVGWAASSDAVVSASAEGFLKDIGVTLPGSSSIGSIGGVGGGVNAAGLGKEFASPVDVQVAIDGDTDVSSGGLQLNVIYAY